MITPSPLTAALAGAFSALAMPFLWPHLQHDTVWLTTAFLLVVAFPAHAFVVGVGASSAGVRGVDVAMLRRVGAWLGAAAVVLAVAWMVRGT